MAGGLQAEVNDGNFGAGFTNGFSVEYEFGAISAGMAYASAALGRAEELLSMESGFDGDVTFTKMNDKVTEKALLVEASKIANALGAPGADASWNYSGVDEIDCDGVATFACTHVTVTEGYRGKKTYTSKIEYGRGAASPGSATIVGRGNVPITKEFETGLDRAVFTTLHERIHTTPYNYGLDTFEQNPFGLNREIDANVKALEFYRKWKTQ